MKRASVAVVGGGLGGMTAAGELARAGFDVTLFEAAACLGGKASCVYSDGVILDTGPTLLTLPGVVRETFARLGAEDLLPRFIELEEHCAYHFSDGCRMSAYRDVERTAESAARLRPIERAGVRSFYAEAEAIYRAAGEPYLEAPLEGTVDYMTRVGRRGLSGLWRGARWGTLAQLAERHLKTFHLRQFAGRFATYAGASPFRASAAFAMLPHIERAFGVHHVQGGMSALVAALGSALGRLGVRVRLGAHASWRPDKGTQSVKAGFAVGPAEDAAHFDAVVVNADPLSSLGRTSEPLALSGYVLLASVDRRLPLPHHSVSFSPEYSEEFDDLFAGRVPRQPTLYLCHPAASDSTLAPPGRSGLFMMVNAPSLPRGGEAQDEGAWAADAARLRELCLEGARRVCPELAGATVRILGERTPVDLARMGAPGGSIYGFLPHGRLGPFRRPRMRSRMPGVFYSGGGTHPGGGVPLVMLSGRFAAELTRRHLGGRA